uniref:Uncharacterized protein n=1 Tax=Arundo donax TaxID=35708 RepID=A0A0A9F8W7_ARUDO
MLQMNTTTNWMQPQTRFSRPTKRRNSTD